MLLKTRWRCMCVLETQSATPVLVRVIGWETVFPTWLNVLAYTKPLDSGLRCLQGGQRQLFIARYELLIVQLHWQYQGQLLKNWEGWVFLCKITNKNFWKGKIDEKSCTLHLYCIKSAQPEKLHYDGVAYFGGHYHIHIQHTSKYLYKTFLWVDKCPSLLNALPRMH